MDERERGDVVVRRSGSCEGLWGSALTVGVRQDPLESLIRIRRRWLAVAQFPLHNHHHLHPKPTTLSVSSSSPAISTSPSRSRLSLLFFFLGDASSSACCCWSSNARSSRTLRIASAFLDGGSPLSKNFSRSSTCCLRASPNLGVGVSGGRVRGYTRISACRSGSLPV